MVNAKITAFLLSFLCAVSLEGNPLPKLVQRPLPKMLKAVWAISVGIVSVLGASRLQTGEYRLPVLPDPVPPVTVVIAQSPTLQQNQQKLEQPKPARALQSLSIQDDASDQTPRFGEYTSSR